MRAQDLKQVMNHKAPDIEPEPYDRLDAPGGVPAGAGSSGQGL